MNIEENVSLADKNWFKTGGAARFFCQPHDVHEFTQALAFAREHKLSIFVLGHGANILMSDEGFDGLVIAPKLEQVSIDYSNGLVTAGAGVGMPDLIKACLDNNLVGLEEFSGIPGTVGGSMYINIHYFEFLLSNFLASARVIEVQSGQILAVDPAWFSFGYNTSTLQAGKFYLVDATFKLKPVSPLEAAFARGRSVEMIRHRVARYPTARTCGSFFRNFHLDEIPFLINDKKIPFVAYYLDKIGVKGALRFGNAVVSHQHANMIVTLEGATSNDVIELVREMQRRVYEQFGIVPQPECQLVGFAKYPLLDVSKNIPKPHHAKFFHDNQP
ncbi:UDP-N-acetylmuramate dehydrogenase [Candidatus Dependentiae bacterium]|nr:UDP-N-acetylmuramate dehydrogenase [Candidatus Dependentiae bacterium]